MEGKIKSNLAHIRYDITGQRIEQTIKEHSINVATLASCSLAGTGFENCAYLAGLLHDMGKCCDKFQEYLEMSCAGHEVARGSVIHTYQGCIYILEKYHGSNDPYEKITAEILASVIGGHHGLYDCLSVDGSVNGFMKRMEKDREEISYSETVANFVEEVAAHQEIESLFEKATDEIKFRFQTLPEMKDWFCLSFALRLIQAAVIAGDHEDTRLFMIGQNKTVEGPHDWSEDITYFEKAIANFRSDTPLNMVRKIISDQCMDAAINRETGIYRLSVGTGGGKTLASHRFSLHHSQKYGKKRVIYVVPFLSILDQNAKVVREYTPPSTAVLEHHSNVVLDGKSQEDLAEYDLLKQSWDAPVIVTTLVQLLDVLFSHRTSCIARMQALVDSIIVIDEVQSLPVKVTAMFSMALNCLKNYCGATILLSSATQPKLDAIEGWEIEYAPNADIVNLTPEQQEVFNRTNINNDVDPYGKTLEEFSSYVRDKIKDSPSTLVICNTKRVAREVFCNLREINNQGWKVYHLSTSMCQKHRMDVLDEIKAQLSLVQEGQSDFKVICVATQLVEAGIDFSFKTVIRALAGLDNIVQAVGRCNRSNEYTEKGEVYIVRLAEENLSMLKEIERGKNCTAGVLQSNPSSITDQSLVSTYFKNYYKDAKDETMYEATFSNKARFKLCELLGNVLQREFKHSKAAKGYFLKQPFKEIAQKFSVFENNTYDAIVPYGESGRSLCEKFIAWDNKYDLAGLGKLITDAKQYTVSLYEYQVQKLISEGLLFTALDGKVLVLDNIAYDEEGVQTDAKHKVDDFIL